MAGRADRVGPDLTGPVGVVLVVEVLVVTPERADPVEGRVVATPVVEILAAVIPAAVIRAQGAIPTAIVVIPKAAVLTRIRRVLRIR
jgi:hypothetical protein